MTKPQRAPLRERISSDPNGVHHTADPDAHTGQVVRHPRQNREVSGVVVPPAPRVVSQIDADRKHAETLAYSDMIPESYKNKPANVVWAINYARDLDLPVSTVLSNVYLANGGKPALTTALMAALVRRSGHKLRIKLHMPSGIPDTETYARAEVIRSDDPDFIFESSPWTLYRAQRAGLVQVFGGKPRARTAYDKVLPWEKYTEAMLKARAMSEVIRDAVQDVFLGMAVYTPEELGADVDEDGHPVNTGRDGEGFPVEEMDAGAMDLSGFDGPDLNQPQPEPQPEPGPVPGQDTADFDPATASRESWSALAQQALTAGDVQALRELYGLFRAHRPEDPDIQKLMTWVTEQQNKNHQEAS